jgi:hypothetical protein
MVNTTAPTSPTRQRPPRERLRSDGQTGSNRNDRLFGRQYASTGNWREDFEVFRPFFQPTKKPTKLST